MKDRWSLAAVVMMIGCGGAGAGPAAAPDADAAEPGEARSGESAPPAEPASEAGSSDAGGDDEEGKPGAPAKKADGNTFALQDSKDSKSAHGVTASKIQSTATEAAVKFIVVDKEKGAMPGIVISLTDEAGKKLYTPETDAEGYTEILVPVGHEYGLVYLGLGKREIAAKVPIPNEPKQNIKLTLRYKGRPKKEKEQGIVLDHVHFDTGKATIRPESFEELDRVAEYMVHKPSVRVEISGHTDNVGDPKRNKALSQRRADACREYLMQHGVDGSRVEAMGYGDEKPVAGNETEDGRQRNRRIEAHEL